MQSSHPFPHDSCRCQILLQDWICHKPFSGCATRYIRYGPLSPMRSSRDFAPLSWLGRSMPRDYKVYLEDMLQAVDRTLRYSAALSFESGGSQAYSMRKTERFLSLSVFRGIPFSALPILIWTFTNPPRNCRRDRTSDRRASVLRPALSVFPHR